MTPDEIRAEIRAAINADPALQALAAVRNDRAIASALSVDRTKLVSTYVSERGVRAALGDVEGARFMRVMGAISEAAKADSVPDWLTAVLTAIGRDTDTHALTLDTMGIAHDWLKVEAGLDIGAEATQGMLDLIAAGQPQIAASCAAIKAMARVDDPVPVNDVSAALNEVL